MATLVKAVKVSEIPEGTGKSIDVQGRSIALFNIQGKFYAIDNTCLHMGGPLGDGSVEGQVTTCPWHGWQYDVTTGVCQGDPSSKVESFKVTLEGDDVLIAL